MKPGFALNLSHDGIGLLHRTPRGWTRVGEVSLDDPGLGETLGFLRKTALGLEPQGLTTKLIIPNSQILYADVTAPGPDAATRRRQIRAALDGMTPYTVDELVFDWTPLEDGRVRVAVVARDTLQEAEEFAADHRMAPVSFVAMPDEGQFAGEPFFGATRLSNSLLPPGERVERDAEPVRLIGGAPLNGEPKSEPVEAAPEIEPEPVAEPEAEPEEAAAPEAVAEPEQAAEPEPLAGSGDAEPEAPPKEATVAADEAEQEDDDSAEALRPGAAAAEPALTAPDGKADEAVAEDASDESEPAARIDVTDEPVADGAPKDDVAPADDKVPEPETAPQVADQPEAAEPEPKAPAEDAEPVLAARQPEKAVAAPAEQEAGEAVAAPEANEAEPVAASAAPAFASRRAPIEGELPPRPAAGGPRLSAVPSRISLPGGSAPALTPEMRLRPEAPVVPPRGKGRKPAAPARPVPPPIRAKVDITPQTPAEPVKPGLGLGGDALSPPPAVAARRPAPEPAVIDGAGPKQDDTAEAAPAAASGVFGRRPVTPVRGKPRHLGLILTLVLLLLLGLVAVWSSLFLGSPDEVGSAPGAEVTPPAPVQLGQPAEQDAAPPMPGPEELLLAEDAPFVTDPGEEIPAEAAAEIPDLPAPGGADLSPDAVASVTPDSAGEVALQRPDPPAAPAAPQPEALRALPTLPSLNLLDADAPPATQIDPAPAEALLAALAAAEAAAAAAAADPEAEAPAVAETPAAEPEEVFDIEVVEGRPSVVPPPNPFAEAEVAAEAPQIDVTDAVLEVLAAEVAAEGSVQLLADPSLAGVRPRARPALPEDAATEAAAPEAEEQGAVESATDDEAETAPTALAAALRPRARPEDAVIAVAAPAEPEPMAEADANVSALAIAASARPTSRPNNFNAAVEQALAAALAAAPPPPQQTAQAPRAPEPEVEEDNEPDIAASAVPNIPTRASVAAAATVTRGINLRQMNLIGVAGTANNRRALVRMSNGRVVQVRVGDRLDGGQVAAIGERQLRYVKGGRTHVLDIPQG